MPRCAWEARLDPITVGFGDEEGVKLYLPFGSIIGHNKVLVTIICDDQSNRSSLLRMHGLSVEHKHVMMQLSLTTMRITHRHATATYVHDAISHLLYKAALPAVYEGNLLADSVTAKQCFASIAGILDFSRHTPRR